MRWVLYPVVLGVLVWRVLARRRGAPARALSSAPRSDVWLVASREYRERARSRTFRASTILVILVVLAVILIPSIGRHHHRAVLRVSIVAGAPAWVSTSTRAVAAAVGEPLSVTTVPAARARDLVRTGATDVVVSSSRLRVASSTDLAVTSPSGAFVHTLALALGRVAAEVAAGLTPAQARLVDEARALPIVGVATSGPSSAVTGVLVLGAIITFVLISQYATWTLLGVMEEKSSRVVEVLLATMRPLRLLAGKVLGIGALALTQVLALALVALIAARAAGTNLLAGDSVAAIAMWVLWALLGYAFTSWIYAAAGSLAERQDQLQSLMLPLNVPTIAGYIAALTAAGAGHATLLVRVFAFVPITSTFAVPTLVGLGALSWPWVVVAALESVAATVLVARLAAAIYRRAILRGGRVRLRDLRGRGARAGEVV